MKSDCQALCKLTTKEKTKLRTESDLLLVGAVLQTVPISGFEKRALSVKTTSKAILMWTYI